MVSLYNNKTKGFTLVELIVVIVILGILAVVAAPKFMSMKLEAKNAVLQGLAGALKSAANEFHAKAVMAGVDNETSSTSLYSYPSKLFDYKSGWSYDRNLDPTNESLAVDKCTASPTCLGILNGYPYGYGMFWPGYEYVQGEGEAPLNIQKLINGDSKFSSLTVASYQYVIFYFTDDKSFVTNSNYIQFAVSYPLALPCSVTYIQAVGQDSYINLAKYDPTTNQYINDGQMIYPGDRGSSCIRTTLHTIKII